MEGVRLSLRPCVLALLLPCVTGQFQTPRTDYMTQTCYYNSTNDVGGVVESSYALRYDSNMDCTYTVSVSAGKRLLILLKRFLIEDKINGSCVDYLNIHDGADTTAPALNTELLCGAHNPTDYVTTGEAMTVHFVTDNSAVQRGFEIVFSAFETAPCNNGSDLRLDCGDGRCIHHDLQCNNIAFCTTDQDEVGCDELLADALAVNVPAIVGGCLGVVAFFLLIYFLYKYIDHTKFQRWVKKHQMSGYPWEQDDTAEYPMTHCYEHTKHAHRKHRKCAVAPASTAEYHANRQRVDQDFHTVKPKFLSNVLDPTDRRLDTPNTDSVISFHKSGHKEHFMQRN